MGFSMYRLLARQLSNASVRIHACKTPTVATNRIRASCFSTSTSTTSASEAAPKAAALIIGNEILSGAVTDTNTPWLAKLLYGQGVDLIRVEYIPDDAEDIRSSVLRLRERVGPGGAVFTSGGIGPTHDDVTYEAIASAFGRGVELHEPTVARMREFFSERGRELNEARLRMAQLPTGAEVLVTPGLWVPLVNLESVYILPGIPRLFTAMVDAHRGRFRGPAHVRASLYTHLGEGDLAQALTKIAAEHPRVAIGSYPNVTDSDGAFRVKLQFSSRDGDALQAAVAAAQSELETFQL